MRERESQTPTRWWKSNSDLEKNDLARVGIEPMAFGLALRRSNHWATGQRRRCQQCDDNEVDCGGLGVGSPILGNYRHLLLEYIVAGRTFKSNGPYSAYQGLTAIELEREKNDLALLFLSNLTTQTEPRKSKIFYQFVEDQRTENPLSVTWNITRFPPNGRRWSHSKLPLMPLTYTETCKNLQKAPCSLSTSWLFKA